MNPTAKLKPVTVATAIALVSGTGLMAAPAVEGGASASGQATQRIDAYQSVQARGAALVEAELRSRGYVITERRRTLLGRNLVRAETSGHVREVVIHQRTGEILRDIIMPKEGSAKAEAGATGTAAKQARGNASQGGAFGLSLGSAIQGATSSGARAGNSAGNASGNTSGVDNGSVSGSVGVSVDASIDASVGGSVGGSSSGGSSGGNGGGSAGGDVGGGLGGGLGIGN